MTTFRQAQNCIKMKSHNEQKEGAAKSSNQMTERHLRSVYGKNQESILLFKKDYREFYMAKNRPGIRERLFEVKY